MPVKSSSFLKWMGFFMRPYARNFAVFLSLRVIRYTILLMLPLIIGKTINGFEQGWAFEHPDHLIFMVGGYMVLYGIALFSMILFFHESAAQDRMIRAMTLFSIRHMNKLPLRWHEEQGSGGKLQRVMTARNAIKQLFNMYKWYMVPFTGSLIAIVLSVSIMQAPWWILLLYLGFILSFGTVGYFVAKPLPGLHECPPYLL